MLPLCFRRYLLMGLCHGSPRNDDPAMPTATLFAMPALTPPATPATMTAAMHHAHHQARRHMHTQALRPDIEALGDDVGPLWGVRNPPGCTGIQNLEPRSPALKGPQPQSDAACTRNPEPRPEPRTPQCHSTQGLGNQGDTRPLRNAKDLPDCASTGNLNPAPLALPVRRHARLPAQAPPEPRYPTLEHPQPQPRPPAHKCLRNPEPGLDLQPLTHTQADGLEEPPLSRTPLALGKKDLGGQPWVTNPKESTRQRPTLGEAGGTLGKAAEALGKVDGQRRRVVVSVV